MRYFFYQDWLGRCWVVPVERRDDFTHWLGWGSIQYPPPYARQCSPTKLTFADPQGLE